MLVAESEISAETTLDLQTYTGRKRKANKKCLLFVLQNQVLHYCSTEQRHLAMLLQLEGQFA